MNETPSEMRQYEQAVLTVDLPEEDLQAGDVGTVVDIHEGGTGYSLEFFTLTGDTIAVVTVSAEKVRPITKRDRVHVRT